MLKITPEKAADILQAFQVAFDKDRDLFTS
jgi:hypothetical protein